MRALTGSRLAGVLSTIAVFLLPAMGVGTASALDVGEVVPLLVPDESEFAEDPQTMDFTCVAVTEHAYWLVQDSTYVGDVPSTPDTAAVWGNFVTQAEIDSLTAQFEGDGVNVFGTVTTLLGAVPDTDDDPRIWIVFADMPDYYQNSTGEPTRVGRNVTVVPGDIDGTESFNNHDIFYMNVGLYKEDPLWAGILRTWYIPNGLGMLIRHGVRPDEELWLSRGLGLIAQYTCYGFTYFAGPPKLGIRAHVMNFENGAPIELTVAFSGSKLGDFSKNQGQEFLWLMYLRQSVGDGICYDIAQADTIGMQAVARAIDPSVPDSMAVVQLVCPIYNDWLITNLVNHFRSDYAGGIYKYAFLEGSEYLFTQSNMSANFRSGEFDEYPFGNFISVLEFGMASPAFSCLMSKFTGDYSANQTVHFNGMYSDGSGSGSQIDGNWDVFVIQTDDEDIVAVNQVDLSEANLFKGTFDLGGGGANYLVTTNNNPGGTSGLRYVVSQDVTVSGLYLTFIQNLANPSILDIYTTPYNTETGVPEGFDWIGPVLEIAHLTGGIVDSSSVVDMATFHETLWSYRCTAWDTGDYDVTVSGYDSAGIAMETAKDLYVGTVSGSGLVLTVSNARVDVAPGAMSPGRQVMLAQTDVLGLALSSQITVESALSAMNGIIEGPVMVTDVQGTISFPAGNARGSIYRWTDGAWVQMDSYYQSGRMHAPITAGGIYVFGTAPGVVSPELPATLTLAGNAPNPFSAETVISFSLPSAGTATLRVYDMTGRVVRVLNSGEMAAASHSVVWDGRDDSGNSVGAGVYFCRLEAAGQSAVQKMLRITE